MNLAVIGSGNVGLGSPACLVETGLRLVAVDNDVSRVDMLPEGAVTVHEHHGPGLLSKHCNPGLQLPSDTRVARARSHDLLIWVAAAESCTGEAALSLAVATDGKIYPTPPNLSVWPALLQHGRSNRIVTSRKTQPRDTARWSIQWNT